MDEMPVFISHQEILELDAPLERAFEAVEKALIEHAKREVEMPPKPGVHPLPRTFIHAMPAYIPALKACGMKWVGGFPGNVERGLPTITGLLVMNDPETGIPLAVMDARWITGIRTGIVSALIVRECAREDVRTLGVAGCGVQGRAHLRAILHVRPKIEEVRLYDVYAERAEELAKEAAGYTDASIKVSATPEECIRRMDVAATCTSGKTLEAPDEWLPEGGTAVGVDSHIAWGASFRTVEKFIMDDVEQAREFEKRGKYPGGLPEIYAEIGEILLGAKAGRETEKERILGLPLGLAVNDIALGRLILDLYEERGGSRQGFSETKGM